MARRHLRHSRTLGHASLTRDAALNGHTTLRVEERGRRGLPIRVPRNLDPVLAKIAGSTRIQNDHSKIIVMIRQTQRRKGQNLRRGRHATTVSIFPALCRATCPWGAGGLRTPRGSWP